MGGARVTGGIEREGQSATRNRDRTEASATGLANWRSPARPGRVSRAPT